MTYSITELDNPRLDPYRNLRRTNRSRWSGQFVVEGHRVVRRLIASGLRIESIVVTERRRDFLNDVRPDDVPLLVVPQDVAAELVGYNFHHGVMACGYRPATPALPAIVHSHDSRLLLVACPRMTDPDNLGGLIRLCAGFGVQGLLLGDDCVDAWSRRVLRVSMGAAFRLPILDQCPLAEVLPTLREQYGCRILAAVLDDQATRLANFANVTRSVLVLGNEADGLAPEWIAMSDERVTIPMAAGTDSLNVTVAAGILLHYLRDLSGQPGDAGGPQQRP
jgi:tRNA G18 (ribose-2'-O)-methylase SpoU